MTRFLVVTCTLSFSVVIASAAPKPKSADEAPFYYPTMVGSKSVYQTTMNDLKFDETYRVTKVVETREGVRVTVEQTKDHEFAVFGLVDVSATGVTQIQSRDRMLPRPIPALRLPAKPGNKWEWEGEPTTDGTPPDRIAYKIAGEEEVEVLAGKFKAIRVDSEIVNGKFTSRTEGWYAPEIGLVKRVFYRGKVKSQVVELKSFTAGKK